MTVELITGHAGSAHISAADDGWLNVGVVGAGKYVLDTGTQFACNVQSANLVTVGIGDALFEGRHVRVSATENVALDNGAQGVNRNDIVCIKYEYNSGTSVETASLAVIKGTAVSGTPSDPTIPSGSILEGATAAYMPLWRIPISGITVGEPEKLYGEVISPLDGIYSKTWDASQIPNLPASKITSGTIDVSRIPPLNASQITSGVFPYARIPWLPAEVITSGTLVQARGGTGRSVATANRTYWCGRVLYNNATGTTGTVSLSETAANFTFMVIGVRSEMNRYSSVFVYSPNGKTVNLACVEAESGYNYIKTSQATINGTSITRGAATHTGLSGSSSATSSASEVYITQVIGFA